MTNDKELIAKITREYCAEQKIPTVLLAVEVCTEVIARYLAERGKDAVAYRHTSEIGSCLNTLPDQLAGWVTEPLFLAPQPAIPVGTESIIAEKDAEIERLNADLVNAQRRRDSWYSRFVDIEVINKRQAELLAAAQKDADSKQARIDELMFEYCPDEMTPEQIEEWAKHQEPVISAMDNERT